jgi:hypothetical protein
MTTAHKTRILIRNLLVLAVALAVAAFAYLGTGSQSSKDPAAPSTALTAGTIGVGNSSGSAIFSASGMYPGSSPATGTVTISNTGDLPGDFTLSKSHVSDTPGAGGGALSSMLRVVVEDITGSPTTIYDGSAAGMGTIPLGSFAPGSSHTYRFTGSLPDHGLAGSNTSGDNAARGASMSIQYDWNASANEPESSLDNPGGGGSTVPSVDNTPPKLTLGGAKIQSVKKGYLVITGACKAACQLRVGGTISVPKLTKVYRIKTVSKTLTKAGKATFKLKLDKKTLRAVRKALAKHKKISAKLTVTATSKAGRVTVSKKTIKLKR